MTSEQLAYAMKTVPKLSRRFARSPDLADDVTGDVYLKLLTGRYEIRDETWHKLLFVIVKNTVIDHARQREPLQDLVDVPDTSRSALDRLLAKEELRGVHERLSDKDWSILFLSAVGHTDDEVAKHFNTSVKNLYLLRHRARQKL